ncbi:MAG: aryl-sulfate sulfotransferase [Taibaiella sp.]|nr:aryl-sulfate sulfotransferase [Taibaiella sp.]
MNRAAFILSYLLLVFAVSFAGVRLYRKSAAHRLPKKESPKPPMPYTFKIYKTDPALKGYLLIAPYELYKWQRGELLIIDFAGRVCFNRLIEGSVYDFRQWRIGGNTYYTFVRNDTDAFHIQNINLTAGSVVVLDSAFNTIKRIGLLPFADVDTTGRRALDLHDFILLGPAHYIALANYERQVSNIPQDLHPVQALKISAAIIQEVKDGKVVWQWDASHFPEFYAAANMNNNFAVTTKTQDYMHINSCCIDPADSNLVVSFRSIDQVVKISRRTGAVLWRLGGKNSDFKLTPAMKPMHQHHATLTLDHKIMMLDNGDSSLRRTSRVLEFGLNETDKTVTSFKAFEIPENYTQHMGSVEKEGDWYIIGGGTAKYILDINSKTGEVKFRQKSNLTSYRIYKVDSLYGYKMPQAMSSSNY